MPLHRNWVTIKLQQGRKMKTLQHLGRICIAWRNIRRLRILRWPSCLPLSNSRIMRWPMSLPTCKKLVNLQMLIVKRVTELVVLGVGHLISLLLNIGKHPWTYFVPVNDWLCFIQIPFTSWLLWILKFNKCRQQQGQDIPFQFMYCIYTWFVVLRGCGCTWYSKRLQSIRISNSSYTPWITTAVWIWMGSIFNITSTSLQMLRTSMSWWKLLHTMEMLYILRCLKFCQSKTGKRERSRNSRSNSRSNLKDGCVTHPWVAEGKIRFHRPVFQLQFLWYTKEKPQGLLIHLHLWEGGSNAYAAFKDHHPYHQSNCRFHCIQSSYTTIFHPQNAVNTLAMSEGKMHIHSHAKLSLNCWYKDLDKISCTDSDRCC